MDKTFFIFFSVLDSKKDKIENYSSKLSTSNNTILVANDCSN